MCWTSTSAVRRFKWDSSCCESCRHCDRCTLKLINAFCGQTLLSTSFLLFFFFILYNTFLTAFYIVDIYGPHPWRTSRRKVLSSTPNGIQKHITALLAPSSRCSRDIQCTWWPGCHMKCSSPWQEHPQVWLLVEHPRSYTDRILENCCWQLTLNLRASKLLQVITCCGPWTQTSRHILLCF